MLDRTQVFLAAVKRHRKVLGDKTPQDQLLPPTDSQKKKRSSASHFTQECDKAMKSLQTMKTRVTICWNIRCIAVPFITANILTLTAGLMPSSQCLYVCGR